MIMLTAVITASATVIVATLVFALNQWGQVRTERRQASLSRLDAQVRDLYGPLKVLTDSNEAVWCMLRAAFLPASAERRSGIALTDSDDERWMAWIRQELMPVNRQMRDVILKNAHLLIESELPEPLRAFCAHVAAYEVFLAAEPRSRGLVLPTLIRHPGDRYITYVNEAYAGLRQRQSRLLNQQAWKPMRRNLDELRIGNMHR